MSRLAFLGLFLSFFVSLSAHATVGISVETYFAKLHFSTQAYGKEVQAVTVHTGVLQRDYYNYNRQPYWTDIKDIALLRMGDHFEGVAVVEGGENSGGLADLGPVVQYWLTFTDGSTAISETYPINFVQVGKTYSLNIDNGEMEYRAAVEDARIQLAKARGFYETSAEMIKAAGAR